MTDPMHGRRRRRRVNGINMPKIAEIEATPNPNAMKFILKEPLTWGITRSYDNAGEAQNDPLAAALFDIEHVTNVFYVDHWITVTQDGRRTGRSSSASWLSRYVKRRRPTNSPRSSPLRLPGMEQMSEADQERLDKINEILDEQVRPYLQGDGGDLYVLGLSDNTLTVHYQGACGSCPSSISGTLAGIESLVRQIEPDIEVVAV